MSDSADSPAAFSAPQPGELAPLFPGYEIDILVATGGMGAVYRAVQKSLERTVAIKILPQVFSKDAAFCAGFEAEAKAMARLNHPNLIGVHDFGEVNGMLYIIMEYVPGESLFHAAHGIAIDAGETIRLVTGICNGLAHAHQNGIVHRDIKPSNILLDLSAQPKIGDFGLARPVELKARDDEAIYGTPHYTAPEVVHAPECADHRSDIFSVGVILHELLTGSLPDDDSQPASAIVPCDPRFDAIIRRATDPRPKYRYTCVREIAKDLHAITASGGPREPVRTRHAVPPQPALRRTKAPPKQKSSTYVGIIMWGLSIVLGIIIYIIYSKQQKAGQIVLTQAPPVTPIPEDIPKPPPVTPIPEDIPKPRPVTPIPEDIPKPRPVTPIPEDIPKPRPDPSPTVPANVPTPGSPVSNLDVPAFFAKARKLMHDKAALDISSHDKNLKKNLTDFELGVRRLIRKYTLSSSTLEKKSFQSSLENFIKRCEKNGCRLPETATDTSGASYSFDSIPGSTILLQQSCAKQKDIDATLQRQLAGLSPIYILGLEQQIKRLDAARDTAATALINEEIQQTRTNATYLPNLMLGIDPNKPSSVKKNDGNNGNDGNDEDKGNKGNYGRKVTVSGAEPDHAGEKAIDNDPATYWSAPSNSRSGWIEIDFGGEITISRAVINQANWPRIRRFDIQARTTGGWKTAAVGTSVDASNRVKFPTPVRSRYFRLNILEATDCPIVAEFELLQR